LFDAFHAVALVAAGSALCAMVCLLRSRTTSRGAKRRSLVAFVAVLVVLAGAGMFPGGPVLLLAATGAGALLAIRHEDRGETSADLTLAERRYDAIFRSAGKPLLLCTIDGVVVDANPAAAALLRRPLESLRAAPLASLIDVLGEQPDRIARSFAERVTGSLTGTRLYRVKLDDRRTVWLEVESVPFATSTENLVLVSSRDVTAREEAAERLRLETARWEILVDSLPAFAWTTDEALRVTGARGRALALLGMTEAEIEGRTLAEIYARLGLEVPDDPRHAHALAGETVRVEWRLRDRIFEAALVGVPGRDGRGPNVAGIALDVTDRERARREAVEKLRTLQDILQQAPALVFLKDLEGRYLWVNRRWERINARSSANAVGSTDLDFVPRAAAEAYRDEDRQVLESGEPAAFVHRIEGRHEVRYFVTSKFVLRDERGAPYAVCGISIDETERESLERELRRQETLLDETQKIAELANWEWDLQSGRHLWPASVYSLYGIDPREDVAGFVIHEGVVEEDRVRLLEHLRSALDDGTPYDIEYRIRRQDGLVRWLHSKGLVERDGDGRPLRFLGFAQDVTDAKISADRVRSLTADLEREVRERTAELETAVRDLERFSYAVSHDLRQPLRAIFGFLALMKSEGTGLGSQSRGYLDLVDGSARRMQSIISDLLTLSRVSHSRLQPAWVDLSEKARWIADERTAAEPERDLRVSIQSELRAMADANLVELLLRSLIDNACKFTRGVATAQIELGCEPGSTPPVYFVRDNGPGFDSSTAHQLFEPFGRLQGSDETGGIGNGMGLATAARIVSRHGGRIWAESDRSHGTTLRFTLAAAERADGAGSNA
jgi:PAS domain S-box-containing protein